MKRILKITESQLQSLSEEEDNGVNITPTSSDPRQGRNQLNNAMEQMGNQNTTFTLNAKKKDNTASSAFTESYRLTKRDIDEARLKMRNIYKVSDFIRGIR